MTLRSPMTDWLGPLVRPRFPVQYLADSRAWPSPLWASNAFSYVLFPSFQIRIALCSILFYSIPFHDVFDPFRFYSILFDSFRLVSLLFITILCLTHDL